MKIVKGIWAAFLLVIVVLCFKFILFNSDSGASVAQAKTPPTATSEDKAAAQKKLDEVLSLAKTAGLVSSYEFSDTARVIYVGPVWYTQTVAFKKDFLGAVASPLETITGYHNFEVLDAYSNEKVAEVTAFSGSLEVYK
jgi:hypothetical protein